MSKERNLCEFYVCKGECKKGKDAEITGLCQHCGSFKDSKRPARKDLRRKKMERIKEKEWHKSI